MKDCRKDATIQERKKKGREKTYARSKKDSRNHPSRCGLHDADGLHAQEDAGGDPERHGGKLHLPPEGRRDREGKEDDGREEPLKLRIFRSGAGVGVRGGFNLTLKEDDSGIRQLQEGEDLPFHVRIQQGRNGEEEAAHESEAEELHLPQMDGARLREGDQ